MAEQGGGAEQSLAVLPPPPPRPPAEATRVLMPIAPPRPGNDLAAVPPPAFGNEPAHAPICHEYTNTGMCSRINGGQSCRYRHLTADHPDVLADKIRRGKAPPGIGVGVAASAGLLGLGGPMVNLDPNDVKAGLYDPGPHAQLCLDFTNKGMCSRVHTTGCQYRHLAQDHPDVIADKIMRGRATPAQMMAAASGVPLSDIGKMAPAPASATPGMTAYDGAGNPIVDPGPGNPLCLDFINKGACQRLNFGQGCRYRHLPPSHPDVVADRLRRGQAPMPNLQQNMYSANQPHIPNMPNLQKFPNMMNQMLAAMPAAVKKSLPPPSKELIAKLAAQISEQATKLNPEAAAEAARLGKAERDAPAEAAARQAAEKEAAEAAVEAAEKQAAEKPVVEAGSTSEAREQRRSRSRSRSRS